MRADAKHKALVDAIVDGEMDSRELSDKAAELGGSLGYRLTVVSRSIAARIISGKLNVDNAEKVFREIYMMLTLRGFAEVAADVVKVAHTNEEAVAQAARALGKGLTKVQKIQKIDKAEREAERRIARGG